MYRDTIAAIATAPGEGGVAIVRISGKDAFPIAARLFSKPLLSYPSHTAHFGKIKTTSGAILDEGLALIMRGPKSYTGEDTVEFHCHGGALIPKQVLEAALEAGARAAGPGEFTLQAFMNGKIDLAQAEAVQQLISAQNERALSSAKEQLQGALSKQISSFQKELTDVAAILEAWVDFPEEGLEFASKEEIIALLENTHLKMDCLLKTFHFGRIFHEGVSLCLAGPPNAGKSSLMNALLGKERAIVTDIPGTTRDVLDADMRLGSLHFRLLDTAGIRETCEVIEQEGIKRSKEAMETADLILLVLDISQPLCMEAQELLSSLPLHKTILVWNKCDLSHSPPEETRLLYTISLSAKEAIGLEKLHLAIEQILFEQGSPAKGEIVLTSARHKTALLNASLACRSVIDGLRSEISPEFLSSDMRTMLNELATVIGTNVGEDILSAIFSKFCVGK